MSSWIPIHTETAIKLLALTNPQSELLAVLRDMEQQGLTVISLQDQDADGKKVPLGEIDPLTFLASFNRGITDEKRRKNWSFLRKQWNLQADVPQDFDGIPVVNLCVQILVLAGMPGTVKHHVTDASAAYPSWQAIEQNARSHRTGLFMPMSRDDGDLKSDQYTSAAWDPW